MALFYFLIVTLPFLSHPLFDRRLGPLTVEKYLGAACFLYAVFHLAARGRAPRLFSSVQARAYLVFFLLGTASWLRLGEPATATTMLVIYGANLLFLVTVVALVDSRERLRAALVAAVGGMGLVSLYVLRDWQVSSRVYGPRYRPGYIAGDANYFTASVLLVLPIALALVWNDRSRLVKLFSLGSLAVTLAATTLAASRGGFLGLLAMMGWLVWRARRRARYLLPVAALLGAFLAISPLSPVHRILHPDYSDTDSVVIHLELWRAGLRIVRDHPLAGVGIGQFKSVVGQYSSDKRLSWLAHNTYLEIASEMGVPGLLLLLGVFGFSFRSLGEARESAGREGDALLRAVALGAQAGLAGFFVAAFFVSAEFLRTFWFVLFLSIPLRGLAAGQSARTPRASATAEASPAPDWPPALGAGSDA